MIETFGRLQAAIVNLEEYRQFQRYQQKRGTARRMPGPSSIPKLGEKAILMPDVAQRVANAYLTLEVAMALQPGEPVFVQGEKPVWRMPIWLTMRGHGLVAPVGTIDVNAISGEAVALSPEEIATIQDRADAIARNLAPAATS